jgi:hypothetical protein
MLLTGVATAAPSATDAFTRCRDLEPAEVRLACYDAAAGRRPSDTPAGAAAAPVARAPTPSPEAEKAEQLRNFGLTPAQVNPKPQGPEAIHSRIAALSTDRIGHAVVTLENGQTWQISDDASRLAIGQDVTIKKAALGSFLMTTEDRRAYSVRRSR